MIDGRLVHREELHAAESQPVGGVDLEAQRLVGVQPLGEPPAQLGPELDGRVLQVAQVVIESRHRFSFERE